DAIAVAKAEPGHVAQRRQIDRSAVEPPGESAEDLGERDLALAAHGDVDVRIGAEVALDVALVLRRVGTAMDRDAARAEAFGPLGGAQVLDVRPQVVREQEHRRTAVEDAILLLREL